MKASLHGFLINPDVTRQGDILSSKEARINPNSPRIKQKLQSFSRSVAVIIDLNDSGLTSSLILSLMDKL